MDELAKKVEYGHILQKASRQEIQPEKLFTKGDDYKELADKLQRMIKSLGYKSSAYIIDSRRMFR